MIYTVMVIAGKCAQSHWLTSQGLKRAKDLGLRENAIHFADKAAAIEAAGRLSFEGLENPISVSIHQIDEEKDFSHSVVWSENK